MTPPITAYIALGSNIEPLRWLQYGVNRLREIGEITAVSSVYETPPFGELDQPNFLDVTVALQTTHSPAVVKQILTQIEGESGRIRAQQRTKWGPLQLDLDILLWGETAFSFGEKPWRVPNPGIAEYAAVAVPLAEIAPDAIYPLTGERIADIAARLGGAGIVRRDDLTLA